MAKLSILTPPDPRLREKSIMVDHIDENIHQLLRDMEETFDENTAGLAAPQVGINRRVVIMNVSLVDADGRELDESYRTPYHDKMLYVINPVITARSDEKITSHEGCLSLPGLSIPVQRHRCIEIIFTDEKEKEHKFEAHGFLAMCFQHEIDHLDGILSIDYLSSNLKRELALRKMKRFTAAHKKT